MTALTRKGTASSSSPGPISSGSPVRLTKPREESHSGPGVSPTSGAELLDLPLSSIVPFRYNPRTRFDPAPLEELAAHIRENGVLAPIIVRPGPWRHGKQAYDLVAGERRWRAADMAGCDTIPAVVWDGVSHADAVAAALAENLLREDLDPVEEARGIVAMNELGMKQVDIARRIGRSIAYISNLTALLKLPSEVQDMLASRRLTGGQARALLALRNKLPEDARPDIAALAVAVARSGASVHRLERLDLPGDLVHDVPALVALVKNVPAADALVTATAALVTAPVETLTVAEHTASLRLSEPVRLAEPVRLKPHRDAGVSEQKAASPSEQKAASPSEATRVLAERGPAEWIALIRERADDALTKNRHPSSQYRHCLIEIAAFSRDALAALDGMTGSDDGRTCFDDGIPGPEADSI